jgi:hypothetical protein
MDTEEQKGQVMKYVVEKIWGNYLLASNNSNLSRYIFQEDSTSPTLDDQHGAIQKIQFWEPPIAKNFKEHENGIDMELILPDFQRFRKRFSNPQTAYSSYRMGKVIPLQLPDGTKWEHIMIKFLNGNDVKITLANDSDFQHVATYNEMGLRNNKSKMPDKQWELLLALTQSDGSISWNTVSNLPLKMMNNLKTRKKLLSMGLKAYFQIKDDPFFQYNTENGYKLKMTLIPEKSESKTIRRKDDDLGIAESYNEQATQTWESNPPPDEW